jgi:hypothetical protein
MSIVECGRRSNPTEVALSDTYAPEVGFTDTELTALALAADPDLPLAEDAVPVSIYLSQLPIALPDWYMPSVMIRGGTRWRIPVIVLIVAAFLIIEGLGFCNTFGQLTLP